MSCFVTENAAPREVDSHKREAIFVKPTLAGGSTTLEMTEQVGHLSGRRRLVNGEGWLLVADYPGGNGEVCG